MRRLAVLLFLLVPAAVHAQYIGHPGGGVLGGDEPRHAGDEPRDVGDEPRDIGDEPWDSADKGLLGVGFGLTNECDIDVDYGSGLPGAGPGKHARFKEFYGVIMPTLAPLPWLDVDCMFGGQAQKIEDRTLAQDPYDNAEGIILGVGLKGHFEPVNGLRLGAGGKVTGSYSSDILYGDILSEVGDLFDDDHYDHHTVDMWLLRTQLFAGGGFDIPLHDRVTLSPYAGGGAGFINGQANAVENPLHLPARKHHRIASIDEHRRGFFFGGLDVHVLSKGASAFRVGLEGQGNGKDWFAGITFSWQR